MKEHEDEIIRIGDLVEAIADSETTIRIKGLRGIVEAIEAGDNSLGFPGPYLSVSGIHPIEHPPFCVTATHARLFRKIHPDGFKKADTVWDWTKELVNA
jgi:hypothetical protein